MNMTVLITGAAGFIGSATCISLIKSGYKVIGIDNFSDAYSPELKRDRLKNILSVAEEYNLCETFSFHEMDITDEKSLLEIFDRNRPEYVVNLAAQAGVRNSIKAPKPYIKTNIVGFSNILEVCSQYEVKHLVYASSSSVYGANPELPFKESAPADHPLSLYAATKRANELLAHGYSHIHNLPTTGLRFFTVYGPWGRPDMALFTFIDAILQGKTIDVYNHGDHTRDFTYIDDIVKGVTKVMTSPASPNAAWQESVDACSSGVAPWQIYNIGNHNPIKLTKYIETLEKCLDMKALKNYLPLQPGDIPSTYADVSKLQRDFDFAPRTSVEDGIAKFVAWHKQYYRNFHI
jgi:UDP-glucuronate 4-epimerase